MLNREGIKKLCSNLGKNNKSTYSVVAISTANGIFRPTFTMLKKGEDSKSKRYAAIREGITELVAIPSYLICGELAAKCGEQIAKKAAQKEIKEMENQGKILTEKAKETLTSTKVKNSKASLMLIGVCAAAGLVIPAICSAIMNPIMNRINCKENKKQQTDYIMNSVIEKTYSNPNPNFKAKTTKLNYYNNRISGMKVGSV